MKIQWRIPQQCGLGRPTTRHDAEHFHFWGPYIQTTQQACNGHPTSTTICDRLLWHSRREISSKPLPMHHLLSPIYQRCHWYLVPQQKPTT